MRKDIHELMDVLTDTRGRISVLSQAIAGYEEAGGALADLGHADHNIERAWHFLNRLIVNGQRPWDSA